VRRSRQAQLQGTRRPEAHLVARDAAGPAEPGVRHADPADRRLGEQLGGVGYVVKPFDPVSIGDFVEGVLVRIERGERDQLRREISSERER